MAVKHLVNQDATGFLSASPVTPITSILEFHPSGPTPGHWHDACWFIGKALMEGSLRHYKGPSLRRLLEHRRVSPHLEATPAIKWSIEKSIGLP